MPSLTCPPAMARGQQAAMPISNAQQAPPQLWASGGSLPLAAHAAQTAQMHGVAAAQAAQQAQQHVQAAQAAHALAASAAQAQMRATHLQQQLQNPPQPSNPPQPALSSARSISATRSYDHLLPTAPSPWQMQPAQHVHSARQFSATPSFSPTKAASHVAPPGPPLAPAMKTGSHVAPSMTSTRPVTTTTRLQSPLASPKKLELKDKDMEQKELRQELERQDLIKQLEHERQQVLQKQKELEQQQELAKRQELERKQKDREAEVQQEHEREKELAELREELEKQKHLQVQQERQRKEERDKQKELQKQQDVQRQQELDKIRELEKQKELERQERQQKLEEEEKELKPALAPALEIPAPALESPPPARPPQASPKTSPRTPRTDSSETVRAAVRAQDPEGLRSALSEAISSGAWQVAEWGYEQFLDLDEKDWKVRLQNSVMAAVSRALHQQSAAAEDLSEAVVHAADVGVRPELLSAAREETLRRQCRESAEQALLSLLADEPLPDELSQAITRAKQAGVHADLISFSQHRLEDIQKAASQAQASHKAEQMLVELMLAETGLVPFSKALGEALEVGVSRKALEQARLKKVQLESQAWKAEKNQAEKAMTAKRPTVLVARAPQEPVPAATVDSERAAMFGGHDEESLPDLQSRKTMPACLPAERSPTFQHRKVLSPSDNQLAQSSCEGATSARGLTTSGGFGRMGAAPRAASVGHEKRTSPRPIKEDLPCYGLDAELRAKAAAKYDTEAEEGAAQWIEAVTGEPVLNQFFPALRSGEVLCQLLNCIRPATVLRINQPGSPFKERENISKFLKACRMLGVQEYALFSTDDLYEEKNLQSVVNCIYALGGAVQRSCPNFQGPHFGVQDTSNAKRDMKRELGPATQTGGLYGPMERSHLDVVSNQIVRGGGC